MNRRVAFYKAGERIGGLVVIGLLTPAALTKDAIYRVRYDCCGREGTTLHHVIRNRNRKGIDVCGDCARAIAGETRKTVSSKAKGLKTAPAIFVDELPKPRRKGVVPSAREVLAWHDRATEIVRSRRSA